MAEAEDAGGTLPIPDPTKSLNLVVSSWINESFQDAQTKVYVLPIGDGSGPFVLTSAYKDAAKQEAKERIALAGARLANVLNDKLK